MKAALVYPHQLSLSSDILAGNPTIYLIEEPLYFTHFRFHRQKLLFHRATLKRLEQELRESGRTVKYIEFHELSDTAAIGVILKRDGIRESVVAAVTDDWLKRRLSRGLNENGIALRWAPSPLFITPQQQVDAYRPKRSDFYFFSDFYLWQRRRTGLLMKSGKPEGGKWSFDEENREKLPKDFSVPSCGYSETSSFAEEAARYVSKHFPEAPGGLTPLKYPDSRTESLKWFDKFLKERFALFGPYEDAISREHPLLFHSLLTPALNTGLISPGEIVNRAAKMDHIPLNSREGFIRQIIGWREFVRLVYEQQGRKQRTQNALQNHATLPSAFYTARTGVLPVDTVIKRVLADGYCHHIERLMILGNFMLLCEIDPDQVYRWFMELFIDAYDWVMVPNVYGMSQYADGGLMTTKPYISGSSYVLRMSNYGKGSWCEIWDGLYWRFVDRNLDLMRGNPRLSVMASMRDKLQASGKLKQHLDIAERYLEQLFNEHEN